MSFCNRYLHVEEIVSSKKFYAPFKYKLELENEFLSGARLLGLNKIFCPKGHTVKSTKKLYVEIGLHTLRLKEVKEGRTKNGFKKMTVSFYKSPNKYDIDGKEFHQSLGNNSDVTYDTIDCTHMLMAKSTGDFKSEWFRPFTRGFTKEDFRRLPVGKELKAVVAHKEEAFILNGKQVLYERGVRGGCPIILIKPEIVSVHHVDTLDKDIEVNYFKLYIPLKHD